MINTIQSTNRNQASFGQLKISNANRHKLRNSLDKITTQDSYMLGKGHITVSDVFISNKDKVKNKKDIEYSFILDSPGLKEADKNFFETQIGSLAKTDGHKVVADNPGVNVKINEFADGIKDTKVKYSIQRALRGVHNIFVKPFKKEQKVSFSFDEFERKPNIFDPNKMIKTEHDVKEAVLS